MATSKGMSNVKHSTGNEKSTTKSTSNVAPKRNSSTNKHQANKNQNTGKIKSDGNSTKRKESEKHSVLQSDSSTKRKITNSNVQNTKNKAANRSKTKQQQNNHGKPKSQKTTMGKNESVVKYQTSYACISIEIAEAWCKRDAKGISSDIEKYTKRNTIQYYLLTNTWLLLAEELCNSEVRAELLFSFNRDGVLKTIRNASEMLDNVRRRMRGDDVKPYTPFPSVGFCEDVRIISEILAFPKRFSPYCADLRDAEAIRKFYDVNKRCRVYGRSNGVKWLEDRLKEKFAILFKGFKKNYKKYSECVYFSSGVCADAKVLSQKVKAYVAGNPDHEIFGFRFKTEDYRWGTENAKLGWWIHFNFCERNGLLPLYTCSPTCVPKNYKTPRIICPEPAYAASKKQGILRAIRDCISGAPSGMQIFDDSDQSTNQELAFLGSRDGNYATIDKTSASDSISAALMSRILPNDVWEAIWPYYVSWFVTEKGQYVHKDMFASSGDPICFILEGCLFSALEMVAEDLVDEFEGVRTTTRKCYTGRVFGDDVITNVKYYQTYCDIAELLGCIINQEKSYADGPFRESCGTDFFYGMNVSARYWPRKEIDASNPERVVSIIQLQHRLYDIISCRHFLTEFILSVYPDMTFSEPGTDCDDLWGSISEIPTVSCPIDKIRMGAAELPEYALREVHYSLESSSPKGDSELLQIYHYYKFLCEGPQYDDPLSELLKVSSPRSRNGEFAKPTLTLRRKRKS